MRCSECGRKVKCTDPELIFFECYVYCPECIVMMELFQSINKILKLHDLKTIEELCEQPEPNSIS